MVYIEKRRGKAGIGLLQQMAVGKIPAIDVAQQKSAVAHRTGEEQVWEAVGIVIAKSRSHEVIIADIAIESVFLRPVDEMAIFIDEQHRIQARLFQDSGNQRKPQREGRHKQIELAVIVHVRPGWDPTAGDLIVVSWIPQPGL